MKLPLSVAMELVSAAITLFKALQDGKIDDAEMERLVAHVEKLLVNLREVL